MLGSDSAQVCVTDVHLSLFVLRICVKKKCLHVCISIQMSRLASVCKPMTHFTPRQSNAHFLHGCGTHFIVRAFLYTLAPGVEGGTGPCCSCLVVNQSCFVLLQVEPVGMLHFT